MRGMCRDCPTRKGRAKSAIRELGAALTLPVVGYVVPAGLLVVTGFIKIA